MALATVLTGGMAQAIINNQTAALQAATDAGASAAAAASDAAAANTSKDAAATSASAAATSAAAAASSAASINPATLVHLAGTENITGEKTFTDTARATKVSETLISEYSFEFVQSSGTTNAGRSIWSQGSTYALATSVNSSSTSGAFFDFQWITRSSGALQATALRLRYNGDVEIPTGDLGIGSGGLVTGRGDLQITGVGFATSQWAVGDGTTNYSGWVQNLSNTTKSISIEADPNNVGSGSTIIFKIDGAEVGRFDSGKHSYLGGAPGAESLRVMNVTSAVNRLVAYGSATTQAPQLVAEGSDANINLAIAAKGTGAVMLFGNTKQVALFNNPNGAEVNYWDIRGSIASGKLYLGAAGNDANTGLNLSSKGVGNVVVSSRNGSAILCDFTDPNAGTPVNYIQIVASATGADPGLYAQGTDANIDLQLAAKGTGTVLTSSGLLSNSPTNPIGYTAGSGGLVTQLTNKSTGVTLNKVSGQIAMNGAALGSGNRVSFTLTNSVIGANDVVVVSIASGAAGGTYWTSVTAVAAGSCRITLCNASGGSLSEAVVLNFVVIKGAAA